MLIYMHVLCVYVLLYACLYNDTHISTHSKRAVQPYVYIYMHMLIKIYTYTHTQECDHMQAGVCTCVCVCAWMNVCLTK